MSSKAKKDKEAAKAADKEAKRLAREEKYNTLRANVRRRRMAYWWFIVLALIVFAVSIVDILFLESVLMWGVVVAYVVLIIWAFLLYFSRHGEYQLVTSQTDREYLRCKSCRHVFSFDMQHLKEDRKNVLFTCPECGTPGRLPAPDVEPVPAAVPGGEPQGPRFVCGACDEHWSVGALGHDPKSDVHFEACPHCGSADDLRMVAEDYAAAEKRAADGQPSPGTPAPSS